MAADRSIATPRGTVSTARWAVGLSIVAHVLVAGVVIARVPADDEDRVEVVADVASPAQAIEVEVRDLREPVDQRTVTEVALLDEPVAQASGFRLQASGSRNVEPHVARPPAAFAAIAPPVAATTTTPTTTAASISTTTGTTVETAPAAATSTDRGDGNRGTDDGSVDPGHASGGDRGTSRYFTMRGPDLSLPGAVADRIVAGSRPLAQGPDESRIVHNGRGVYIPDLQVPATVNDDGTVKFHDKPAADIHWRIHIPSAKDLGDMLATWYADPYAQTQGRPWQELNKVDQAVEGDNGAGWDSGGAVEGRPAMSFRKEGYSSAGQPQVPIVGGALDITSWAMRKFHVGDPYASRKMKLLADTFDARAAIGARNREQTLDHSIASMERNVVRVWQAPKLTVAERREALFALWDECADANTAQVTPHELEAGARARIVVVSFIRSHFPAGSAIAFTPAEIAAFDAHRSSQQHFAPYASEP